MVGIIIIMFFAVVAIFAPIISPLDPLTPRMEGYYIQSQPKLCEKLCVPIWYKTLLGMNDLSENFIVFADHEYMTADSFTSQVEWQVLDAGYDVNVQYNPSSGTQNMETSIGFLLKIRQLCSLVYGNTYRLIT